MSQPYRIRQHLGTLPIAFMFAFMGIMGTPGMDYMNTGHYDSDEEKAEALEERPFWGHAIIGLYWFNREYRRPAMEHLKRFERPFRLAQDWNLYRDGPSKVRRLNIYVDGELKHRSADPDATWLNPQLRNRHIRPALENAARKSSTVNWPGIVRFLTERAREDFPGCTEVKVEATWSSFPGKKPVFKHGYVATAPSWQPVALVTLDDGTTGPEEPKTPKPSREGPAKDAPTPDMPAPEAP